MPDTPALDRAIADAMLDKAVGLPPLHDPQASRELEGLLLLLAIRRYPWREGWELLATPR